MYIVQGQGYKRRDTKVIYGNGVQMYNQKTEGFQQPSVWTNESGMPTYAAIVAQHLSENSGH